MATVLKSPTGRRTWLAIAVLATAMFAIFHQRTEASASGGCCGWADCRITFETCNGSGECSDGEDCCIGSCL